VDAKAATMLQESALTPEQLASVLNELVSDHERLLNMACAAHSLAKPDATEVIANACEEVAIC
jgi:UDP-N-acetylglucosamine--N-acetylmuramyl-(pentapeptide) pyrophosphoryl-undecaprenol N-acetylglucosamine transferase